MAALETAVERLRPFLKNQAWDYCIIWKLGDDPSRFIEFGACCCSGGNGGHVKIKEETDVEKHLIIECKDRRNKHPVRTKACKALAQIPSSIGLYSGIHGEVVISKQPKWLTLANASNSNSLTEPFGTQVLIPVVGGLVELFSSKQVLENQKTIEHISAQFKFSLHEEKMTEKGFIDFNVGEEQFSDPYANTSLHHLNLLPTIPPPLSVDSSFEGSSIMSTLSDEHLFGNTLSVKLSAKRVEMPTGNLSLKRKHKNGDENGSLKDRQRGEKEHYQSKNLITERNRRKRIKDGLFALRSLVPKITKMDRVSIVGDAIKYIKELEGTIENYKDELREMSEDDNVCNAKTEPHSSIKERADGEDLPANKEIKSCCSSASEKKQVQVEVEVSQVRSKVFLLRCIYAKKRGGFLRFMEAMDSLGLQVIDVNVTTLSGSVLNVFTVEANRGEYEPKSLKQFLIQLVNN